jgi:glycosyltransferase involved in cell wall biosynthesis
MNLSLVVPTRNRPESCIRLLEALIAQANNWKFDRELELNVVDDGSDATNRDHLVEALSVYPPNKVRLIVRKVAGGPSAARNTGIRAARGDILAFLDDDCIPQSGFLDETIRLHRLHPEALVISGNLRSLRNDSISRFWFHYYDSAFNTGKGELYPIHHVSSGHFSIKRRLLERFDPLFDESLPSREDYDLYLRLKQAEIAVYKADSINALIECRSTFRALLKQRAWYKHGQRRLSQKYGDEFLRTAQKGAYPKPSLSFWHIHLLLFLDRTIRSIRTKVASR